MLVPFAGGCCLELEGPHLGCLCSSEKIDGDGFSVVVLQYQRDCSGRHYKYFHSDPTIQRRACSPFSDLRESTQTGLAATLRAILGSRHPSFGEVEGQQETAAWTECHSVLSRTQTSVWLMTSAGNGCIWGEQYRVRPRCFRTELSEK